MTCNLRHPVGLRHPVYGDYTEYIEFDILPGIYRGRGHSRTRTLIHRIRCRTHYIFDILHGIYIEFSVYISKSERGNSISYPEYTMGGNSRTRTLIDFDIWHDINMYSIYSIYRIYIEYIYVEYVSDTISICVRYVLDMCSICIRYIRHIEYIYIYIEYISDTISICVFDILHDIEYISNIYLTRYIFDIV